MTTPDITTLEPSFESRFAFSKNTIAIFALLMGVIAIGFAPIFVRLSDVGTTAIGFWRVALSCPVLALLSFYENTKPKIKKTETSWHDCAWVLLAGGFFGADLTAWNLSIDYTTIANATLLCNLAPLMVILWGWLVWKNPIKNKLWYAIGLIIIGCIFLTGHHSHPALPDATLGDALAVLSAVFYAGYFLTIGNARHTLSTNETMAIATFGSSLTLGLVAWMRGEVLIPQSWHGWEIAISIAFFGQLLGQSLVTFAMPYLSLAFSAAMLLIQPIVAALLSWWLFGETLAYWQVFGMIVTIVGIYCAKLAD